MEQFSMPEGGEFTTEDIDKYVTGVRVYEDHFEWLLNLDTETRGKLDDAGSPVYFKKLTVTPDDEREWFSKHSPLNHFFRSCGQAFPQEHRLAVGKAEQVGKHPIS